MKTDLFAVYARNRLDHWGYEFSLKREWAPEHKNLLQRLIEHKGEIPVATGYKPSFPVTELGWQTECIITEIHRDMPAVAWVMRAMYCGWERRGVERYELAQRLSGDTFSRRTYFNRHDTGFDEFSRRLKAIGGEALAA